jgi:hypothetical protein
MEGCSLCVAGRFPDSDEEGLIMVLNLAEKGNAWAQFVAACQLSDLSAMADNEQDQKRYMEQAVRWGRQAELQGMRMAASWLVLVKKTRCSNRPSNAIVEDKEYQHWIEVAAQMGDADAQSILGAMFDHSGGDHRVKDQAEAVKWYSLAVCQEQGNATQAAAAYNLARRFQEGVGGLAVCRERTRYYFEIGARNECEESQYHLSQLLFQLESDLAHIFLATVASLAVFIGRARLLRVVIPQMLQVSLNVFAIWEKNSVQIAESPTQPLDAVDAVRHTAVLLQVLSTCSLEGRSQDRLCN